MEILSTLLRIDNEFTLTFWLSYSIIKTRKDNMG